MDYELAKELKDAGFPEITRIGAELNLQRYRPLHKVDAPSFPYLQELIAECGDSFEFLGRNRNGGGGWVAGKETDLTYFGESLMMENYATPEEAVARLWIALNKEKPL